MSEAGSTRRQLLQAGAAASLLAATGHADTAFAARRPNVVLIVMDTLRADYVFSRQIHTPNIDSLARAGVTFTNVFPEAMPTVPARNSILSGKRGFPFRGWHDYRGLIDQPGWQPLDDVSETFTSALRRAGYWTGYATDNPFIGFSQPYEPLRRSFDRFTGTPGQLGVSRPPSSVSDKELRHWIHPAIDDPEIRRRVRKYMANGHYVHDESSSFAARVFSNGARIVENAPADRPVAVIVDTFQPHEPWTPPRKYLELYARKRWSREPSFPIYGSVDGYVPRSRQRAFLRRMRALYAAELTMTDHWLGVFLDRLRAAGRYRDTAIVLVGDHGIYLGEHGWTGKISTSLHPELIRVPLIVVDPSRRKAGRRSEYFASTHDIGPTLLSIAGVKAPKAMTGTDLSRMFRGRRLPERPYAYGGYRDDFYIRTRRWALTGSNRPADLRLYDLHHDRGENHDLAGRHPGKTRELYGTVLRRAGGRLPFYDT
jgi:arylsulfatase A-like enzyme